jgi:hypothetical protein
MKTLSATLLSLALPIAVGAQQPSVTQQANAAADPVTTAFRTRTLALQRNVAQALDSIPAAQYSYKPTAAQLTVGYIAQHLASDNYLFCNAFGAMKGQRAEKDTTTADSVKATWPKDVLIAQLKESLTFCENALSQLDDAKLGDSVTLTFNGTARQIPRVNMVLGHALDLADHYSQLANYMRLNNILPPTALPRPGRGGQ